MTDIAAQLKSLVHGLWFPSETEAPWTQVQWHLGPVTPDNLRRYSRRPPSDPVQELSPEAFVKQVAQRCQGYGEEGAAIAQRHHDLIRTLEEHLQDLRIFRVGAVTIDILVLGRTAAGQVVGVQTQSVET